MWEQELKCTCMHLLGKECMEALVSGLGIECMDTAACAVPFPAPSFSQRSGLKWCKYLVSLCCEIPSLLNYWKVTLPQGATNL